MAVKIFPVAAFGFPEDVEIDIKTTVNPLGGLREQRIVNDIPAGPRESGVGTQRTFIGRGTFSVGIPRVEFRGDPFPGNANLENSVEAAWIFFIELFYDDSIATPVIGYPAFYYYDPLINDDKDTWKGDTVANGTNTRGEAVSNVTGRYLVRFVESKFKKSHFIRCLTSFSLELIEVAA